MNRRHSRLHQAARSYAQTGWALLPLAGKIPAISAAHGGHGVLDATTDLEQIDRWWSRVPNANIGGRVPQHLVVIDLDPRHGALENDRIDDLPHTLTAWSERRDLGRHLYFWHPGGALSAARLPAGWDLKQRSGYLVLPPSVRPATGQPYWWDDATVAPATVPGWLLERLRPKTPPVPRSPRGRYEGDSIARWFNRTNSWCDVLLPAGWRICGGDGEGDGSRWIHPAATSSCSATIRFDCLFVYSTNTAFEPTEPGVPRGYNRFRAFAVLFHGGDLRAAARDAGELRRRSARRELVDRRELESELGDG